MGRIDTGVRALAGCMALVLSVGGCYLSYADVEDGEHEADPASDADGGVEAVDDGDAEAIPDDVADEDAPAEVDGATCPGWYDPATGLCWQNPPDEAERTWDDAAAYCEALVLDGRDDWRMPTISELRSLIRGCPSTETGGPCRVTDSCLAMVCWSDSCAGCPTDGGPGTGGAYWPSSLAGPALSYWSSSSFITPGFRANTLYFRRGNLDSVGLMDMHRVRCVRPGP